MIARSGAFGVNSDEGGAVIALMCHQEDISLLKFLRTYHIVENKPSMKADAMMARFMELGGDYELIERSETKAAIRIWREGGAKLEFSLTMDEVKQAGYCFAKDGKTLSRNWRQHPKNMLWARVVSDAIRALDPRVNAGTYTPEEEADIQQEHDAPQPNAEPKPLTAAAEPKPKLPALEKLYSSAQPQQAATTATAADDPFASPFPSQAASDGTDYDLVPIGKNAGKKWGELSRETLQKVVANPGPLSAQHLERAKAALDKTPF